MTWTPESGTFAALSDAANNEVFEALSSEELSNVAIVVILILAAATVLSLRWLMQKIITLVVGRVD